MVRPSLTVRGRNRIDSWEAEIWSVNSKPAVSTKFDFNLWYLSIYFTISSILISENVMSASPSLIRKISWIKDSWVKSDHHEVFWNFINFFEKRHIFESFDVFDDVIIFAILTVVTANDDCNKNKLLWVDWIRKSVSRITAD